MLYVVDTPPIWNTDKVYGIDGHLSFPNLEDIQAAVELWAQFYGLLESELANGVVSTQTRWHFWD